MKPFLLLGTRDTNAAAMGEYLSVLRHCGLAADDLRHLRVEESPMPIVRLDDYSGILLGGSPFNASDLDKSELQLRVESDLQSLLQDVLTADFPFLGLCYGVGLLTLTLGGAVDSTYTEPVSAVDITLTPAGRADPLLDGLPDTFRAFTGHKEACARLPEGVELLATGEACPYQMYRYRSNVYVTQFHPELDADDLAARMRLYQHMGYFAPEEMEGLIERNYEAGVTGIQHRILSNFVALHAN